MNRRLSTLLLVLSLCAVSCEFNVLRALPDVAAPPPSNQWANAPRPEPSVGSESIASSDPRLEAVVARFLKRGSMGLSPLEIRAVARAILDAASEYSVDPSLVMAVIHVESRYDAFAVSQVGALGLMQILPSTGRELAERIGIEWNGPATLFDPVANVTLGVAYLRELKDRFGDTGAALAAYNWGPGRIRQRLREGEPMPTTYPGLVFAALDAHSERSL